jgi:RecB family exonuclease
MQGVGLDLTELQRLELEGGLWRDLEAFVRAEAELETPLVPRRFELSFGSERSAPELQRGLDLGGFTLSGKIDRIDVDPFSARGIVQDYKSGKTAHSARRIESELRLQIPLYMLVLRDLVGIEPLGGVYRALGGKRETRGLLRAEAREDGVPGYHANDYVDEDGFWSQVELAQERAREIAERIRSGDVRHDPRSGDCPDWCELWSMCRVKRA